MSSNEVAEILGFNLASCARQNPSLDLDHRALQMRQSPKSEVNLKSELEVVKSTIGALQDMDFTIKATNSDLGIINAEMEVSDSSAFSQYVQSTPFYIMAVQNFTKKDYLTI